MAPDQLCFSPARAPGRIDGLSHPTGPAEATLPTGWAAADHEEEHLLRALLTVIVLMLYVWSAVAAIGLTGYLVAIAVSAGLGRGRPQQPIPAPPSPKVVPSLLVIALFSLLLTALPFMFPGARFITAWCCVASSATAAVLWRRTRRHRPIEPASINQRTASPRRNER